MMPSPLISIIVPVYNVEKYVSQCLDSLVNQTYKNIEIILVNDGSTDRSGLICNEFAAKDHRIKVVNQNNQGVSASRNKGLTIAKGEYIGFVDSDDFCHPNMYETLLQNLIEAKSDIVICEYQRLIKGKVIPVVFPYPTNISKYEFLKLILTLPRYERRHVHGATSFNKLYTREIIGNTTFRTTNGSEDEIFLFELAKKTDAVTFIHTPLYFFRSRENSLTTISDFSCNVLNSRKFLYSLCQEEYQVSILNLAYIHLLITICWKKLLTEEKKEWESYQRELLKTSKIVSKSTLTLELGIKFLIKCLICQQNYKIARFLRNLYSPRLL